MADEPTHRLAPRRVLTARHCWPAQGGAVLYPLGESADGKAVYRRVVRGGVFFRGRWSHDKVVRSTHGVNCTGSCSWKVYVKDGIITWEAQQTDYPSRRPRPARSTSPAAARAAPPSPGTPTRRRGCATRTCGRAARDVPRGQGPHSATRSRPGRDRRRPREGAAATRPAARAVWCAPRGTRRRDGRRGPRAHDQDVRPGPGRRLLADPGDVDGLARAGARFISLIGGDDAVVLRLVRRPAGRLAAGVRRPDRRARVRRLVGRRLPDHVGLERPGHPHAGRALDAEARYRGQKVVVVSPDYADNVKFADEWLPGSPAPTGRWRWRWAT